MGDPEQFGAMFAHAATGFAVTGCDGRILHANKALAGIIDRTASEINEANLFELTHPDDQSKHRKLLNQLLAAEIPGYIIEKRLMRPDGTSVWVRNSVSLVGEDRSQDGKIVHICEDITDRKRAEQILERQEQMAAIGRLTSSIVHEINNPLEAVFNLIYLARRAENQAEAGVFLKIAEEELSRASEITMQGLQFHRQSTVATSSNVVEIMRTVLVLFKGKLRGANIRVAVTNEDSPELLCFAGEVRQVFVNLISNAVESMPAGGLLTVRVRPGTDWRSGSMGVRVTVADSGSGISAETRQRMYEAFYTTKGSGGSGLGLWVTANIVRKHQGSMHVRSKRGDGSGTVFTLVFPYRGAEGKTAGFQDAA
jgi:PAS domain S-box-containing protein